jgi:hypothetical protein
VNSAVKAAGLRDFTAAREALIEAGVALKSIRAELDDSKLKVCQRTVSLPFEAGQNRRATVKIVDDRGIKPLKVLALGPASA